MTGQRQQLNSLTAYIDASNVYGSTKAVSKTLRTFEKGVYVNCFIFAKYSTA